MKLVFSSDHAGFHLRKALVAWSKAQGYEVVEVGAPTDAAYDYPVAADEGVAAFFENRADFGVFICGSGTGICMRANRYNGIRGANCVSEEIAALARQHNHANVLCLGEREVEQSLAERILKTFLETPEDEAERHVRRATEIDAALKPVFERTK